MMETRGLVHSAIFDFFFNQSPLLKNSAEILESSELNSYEISSRIISEFYCHLLHCTLYAISFYFIFATFHSV